MALRCSDEDRWRRKRDNANRREKTRNIELGAAYDQLKEKFAAFITPTDEDIPKIKRLKISIEYIKYLEQLLVIDNQDEQKMQELTDDFVSTARSLLGAKNSYTDRMLMETEIDAIKKRKRTRDEANAHFDQLSDSSTNSSPHTSGAAMFSATSYGSPYYNNESYAASVQYLSPTFFAPAPTPFPVFRPSPSYHTNFQNIL